jgi:hypothetical protein
MPRKRETELPERVSFRMDARLRYLAELAAHAQKITLTAFIENAVEASFAEVDIDDPAHRTVPMVIDPVTGKIRRGEPLTRITIASEIGNLWNRRDPGTPFDRMWCIAEHPAGLEWLLTDEQQAILKHIHSSERYIVKTDQNSYSYNKPLIDQEWQQIKTDALKGNKKGSK